MNKTLEIITKLVEDHRLSVDGAKQIVNSLKPLLAQKQKEDKELFNAGYDYGINYFTCQDLNERVERYRKSVAYQDHLNHSEAEEK